MESKRKQRSNKTRKVFWSKFERAFWPKHDHLSSQRNFHRGHFEEPAGGVALCLAWLIPSNGPSYQIIIRCSTNPDTQGDMSPVQSCLIDSVYCKGQSFLALVWNQSINLILSQHACSYFQLASSVEHSTGGAGLVGGLILVKVP